MTKNQKHAVTILSIVTLLIFCFWFFWEPSFEPAAGIFVSLSGLAALHWPRSRASYKRERPTGRVTFDYSKNNGLFAIGKDELYFETQWTKASDTSIHVYNDRPSVQGVTLAAEARRITDITDAGKYDMSSRSVTPQEGEIVVLKNLHGNYAVVRVLDVKDRTRSDSHDELTFEYSINPAGGTDFSE